jgi:hypothetical protein
VQDLRKRAGFAARPVLELASQHVEAAGIPVGTARALSKVSPKALRGDGSPERTKEISMFLGLFGLLLVLWLLGFFAFHVAGGLIHLLLIVAVIALVVHFVRGRSAA